VPRRSDDRGRPAIRGTPGIIRYQGERTLDQCPAYRTALQLRVPGAPASGSVFVGLKRTGLDVYLDPSPAFHYDLAGRLEKMVDFDRYLRRSHGNEVLVTRKEGRDAGGGLRRSRLEAPDAATLCDEAAGRLRAVAEAARGTPPGDLEYARPDGKAALAALVPRLETAARFDAAAAAGAAREFARIYRPIAILPPDQYRALVLQATEGCLYNACRFCGFYRGIEYHRKSEPEFREHVRDVKRYWGEAIVGRTSIFLGQANALTLDMRELRPVFRTIRDEFPESEYGGMARKGVDSFLDAFTGRRKSVEDFRDLRGLGLHRVYVGMETASRELLRWLAKPGTPDDVVETVRRLREAEVHVGIILLAGIGGRAHEERHVRESVEAVRAMDLGWADRVYISKLVDYSGSTYFEEARASGFDEMDDLAVERQTVAIAEGIRRGFASRSGPRVARYRVENFVY
jgi:hypothetical protein